MTEAKDYGSINDKDDDITDGVNNYSPSTRGCTSYCGEICRNWISLGSEYLRVIRRNRGYQLYLSHQVFGNVGDWFVLIAALLQIERFAPGSGSALSILFICKTFPQIFLAPFAGALADTFDRRVLMVILDGLSAVVVLGYLYAIETVNVTVFFMASASRSSIRAIRKPVDNSILPLIVEDKEDLKRAMTLSSLVKSGSLAIGGFSIGYASSLISVEACFVIDSIVYIISALIFCFLKGDFCVADRTQSEPTDRAATTLVSLITLPFRPIIIFLELTKELFVYLWVCGFGLVTLLKATGAAIYGTQDILNVSFTHIHGDEAATSRRLGLIYSCMGIGCIVGPVVTNFFTDIKRPATLQLATIVSFAVIAFGWIGIANAPSFAVICFFTVVRSVGSSVVLMNATLLLQTLSSKETLGRVLAFHLAAGKASESAVAYTCGRFQDIGYDRYEIATGVAASGGALFGVWIVYHWFGGGAARRKFNMVGEGEYDDPENRGEVSDLILT